MLKRLYLNNCFTHQDRTFIFEKGLTGVIGPNESGKSLIVEMIRFALFGSKALRGKSEDYKKLHVELDFVVTDREYTVVRKGTKVKLTSEVDGLEVVGTKPVDEAIREILGYDLTVFDVANACNQGNIEALSDMTPSNRKAMIDQTIGLTALDDLIKLAGQEGNALKREAEAMGRGLTEPVEPKQPDDYTPSEGIVVPSDELAEFNQLKGFLSHVPREPVEPEAPSFTETVEDLRGHEETRDTLKRSIQNLERKLNGIEPEELSEAELATWEQHHDLYDAWKQKQKLLAQGHICCPECGHEWPVADLGDLESVQEVEAPRLSRREISQHLARVGNDAQRAEIQLNINALEKELEGMLDRAEDLRIAEQYEASMASFRRQKAAWDEYNAELPQKQARYEELVGIEETVARLQEQKRSAEDYERDLRRFRSAMVDYESKLEEIETINNRSGEYLKAREIIQALKVSVKSHLLPSLNKVSSMLLSQMTGGERYQVEIDDDFEILVDGQRISTLSGSGKAVANLSIRIALGQILTNRVFSVFMADEVDASMDDDRADYTAQALRRLTENIHQVITVTHKRPETDQTIELKK